MVTRQPIKRSEMTDDALEDNAAALAAMAEQGDDLTQARDVEFAHVFGQRSEAEAFCAWAKKQGYSASVEERDDASTDVIIRHRMIPELRPLTDLEFTLAGAAEEYSGDADGWGCFAVPKLQS